LGCLLNDRGLRLFQLQDFVSGGLAYESLLTGLDRYRIQNIPVRALLPFHKGLRFQQLLRLACYNLHVSDLDLRTLVPTVSLLIAKRKNTKHIALFHHHTIKFQPHPLNTELLFKLFVLAARKFASRVVVVSKFWEDFLVSKGITRTHIIYNSFDVNFVTKIKDEDCEQVRRKYDLGSKKVIYIGTNQTRKGVHVTATKLSSLVDDYLLVSTGRSMGQESFRVLDLTYPEYLALLKMSECAVAYSLFEEGWCRTVHEAMLVRTPIVGSGAGGMRELLENGGQVICDHPESIPSLVQYAIQHRGILGEKGYNYASRFDLNYFRKEWQNLIDEVLM
jgi:glycosyltransferase involved in cell wall biosynthesis